MTQPQPVKVNVTRRPDFRESYANSVQMRVNLWEKGRGLGSQARGDEAD